MPGENIGVINGATHQVITPTTGWDVFGQSLLSDA